MKFIFKLLISLSLFQSDLTPILIFFYLLILLFFLLFFLLSHLYLFLFFLWLLLTSRFSLVNMNLNNYLRFLDSQVMRLCPCPIAPHYLVTGQLSTSTRTSLTSNSSGCTVGYLVFSRVAVQGRSSLSEGGREVRIKMDSLGFKGSRAEKTIYF